MDGDAAVDEMMTPAPEPGGGAEEREKARDAGDARGERRALLADSPSPERRARAVDELYSHAYEELKRLASAVRYGDAFATVTTTALVHEAWIKLAGSVAIAVESETHLKHIVVRAMRQVLVDSARRRRAVKRGGIVITVDDETAALAAEPEERILAIDDALTRLAALNARQAQMVEARFFGGLDVTETAALLGISEATVHRDWRLARAWLADELAP